MYLNFRLRDQWSTILSVNCSGLCVSAVEKLSADGWKPGVRSQPQGVPQAAEAGPEVHASVQTGLDRRLWCTRGQVFTTAQQKHCECSTIFMYIYCTILNSYYGVLYIFHSILCYNHISPYVVFYIPYYIILLHYTILSMILLFQYEPTILYIIYYYTLL